MPLITLRRGTKMKMKSLGLLLLVVALGLSLSGCGCFQQAVRGEQAPPPAPEQTKAVPPEEKPEVAVTPAPAPEPAPAPAPAPAVAAVELKDINFDFDKYNIRPGDAEILKSNYNWFTANPGKVKIEGNCDERGTVEYNLVLGQKRADSAKSYMTKLGVEGKRMDTISYGKERPMDPGHNEEAWAKNRRVHFEPVQ
jgi:peptidoglycan-associated lipoprotein